MGAPSQPSREELIEEFGEEHVRHTEWWVQEMDRVQEVSDTIMDAALDREDVQVVRRGSKTSRDGLHEVSFTLHVAGEPYKEDFEESP